MRLDGARDLAALRGDRELGIELGLGEPGAARGAGARGLRAILEKVMTDIMFDLPGREDVTEVVITKESIADGRQPLLVTERQRTKKEA